MIAPQGLRGNDTHPRQMGVLPSLPQFLHLLWDLDWELFLEREWRTQHPGKVLREAVSSCWLCAGGTVGAATGAGKGARSWGRLPVEPSELLGEGEGVAVHECWGCQGVCGSMHVSVWPEGVVGGAGAGGSEKRC